MHYIVRHGDVTKKLKKEIRLDVHLFRYGGHKIEQTPRCSVLLLFYLNQSVVIIQIRNYIRFNPPKNRMLPEIK